MKLKVTARAVVNPTEDMEKVIDALSNVLDYDEIEIGEDYIEIAGSKEALEPIREYLEKKKIRDTFRRVCGKNMDDDHLSFKISKQAALVSKINLVEYDLSPLGEIEVTIQSTSPQGAVDWLCNYQ